MTTGVLVRSQRIKKNGRSGIFEYENEYLDAEDEKAELLTAKTPEGPKKSESSVFRAKPLQSDRLRKHNSMNPLT